MRKNMLVSSAIGAALILSQAPAMAAAQAAVDVADVVTGIGNQAAPVALVAGAVLGLHLVVKAYKWIRRAMS